MLSPFCQELSLFPCASNVHSFKNSGNTYLPTTFTKMFPHLTINT